MSDRTTRHYSDTYIHVVDYVLRNGPSSIQSVADDAGITTWHAHVSLRRAVERGHLSRPRRGVYAPPATPTHGAHEVCATAPSCCPSPRITVEFDVKSLSDRPLPMMCLSCGQPYGWA